MSSNAATANFLKAWRSYQSRPVTLAKIAFQTPSALTCFFATTEIVTPDGQLWQTGLSADPLRATLDILGTGPNPVDCAIRLAPVRHASQAVGKTVLNLPTGFLLQNATVTIYLWEQSLASFADALQVFSGQVCRHDADPSGLTLYLLQDLSWNKIMPPTAVDVVSYPNAPDGQQGIPIPVIYGEHHAPPMRAPWTTPYGSKKDQEDSGAGQGVVPMILVDPGIANGLVKVVAASHACSAILDRTNGLTQFIAGAQRLDPLDTVGLATTLGASESFMTISQENTLGFGSVVPSDVRVTGAANTALNPRNAMNVFDETSFATIDQGAGQGILQLVLPNLGSQGLILGVEVILAFIGNAANANNIRVGAYNPGVGFVGAAVTGVATGTTPAILRGAWPAAAWDQSWSFGGPSGGSTIDVRVDFTGGAANKASVLWVALAVHYRPQRSLATPGYYRAPASPVGFQTTQFIDPASPILPAIRALGVTIVQPQFSMGDSTFFGNVNGYIDDGGGTYTGGAGAYIERPPDIAHHLLATYGGASSFQTGAGAFGSFVDARASMRNAGPTDPKLAAWIGGAITDVQTVLQHLCEQALLAVYLDRFTGQWLAHVWRIGATPDYDLAFGTVDQAEQPHLEETSTVDSTQEIRVPYGFDHFKGRTLWEAFISPSGSSQGYSQPTARDQNLTVTTGANDKVDTSRGTATLAAGSYSGIGLAAELATVIRPLAAQVQVLRVSYGFDIQTGYNDSLDFSVGGTSYQAIIPGGSYSPDALAITVANAMTAVPGHGLVFSCSYSQSMNKFTLSATGNFNCLATSGSIHAAQTAWGVLGTDMNGAGLGNYSGAATYTMANPRYLDTFDFDNDATVNYEWASGANVATNAAILLGFAKVDTGFGFHVVATYSRGNRESQASTAQAQYGPHPASVITADWIRDEVTAVLLRNRRYDLTAKPRMQVRFSSFRCPDLRRFATIQFDPGLDAWVPYTKFGSDGSWRGKAFRVIEVEQNLGPSYHTSVVALEA